MQAKSEVFLQQSSLALVFRETSDFSAAEPIMHNLDLKHLQAENTHHLSLGIQESLGEPFSCVSGRPWVQSSHQMSELITNLVLGLVEW